MQQKRRRVRPLKQSIKIKGRKNQAQQQNVNVKVINRHPSAPPNFMGGFGGGGPTITYQQPLSTPPGIMSDNNMMKKLLEGLNISNREPPNMLEAFVNKVAPQNPDELGLQRENSQLQRENSQLKERLHQPTPITHLPLSSYNGDPRFIQSQRENSQLQRENSQLTERLVQIGDKQAQQFANRSAGQQLRFTPQPGGRSKSAGRSRAGDSLSNRLDVASSASSSSSLPGFDIPPPILPTPPVSSSSSSSSSPKTKTYKASPELIAKLKLMRSKSEEKSEAK